MPVEKLKEHKEHILTSFRETMEFKAFTDLAYVFASEFVKIPGNNKRIVLGHSQYGSEIGMSDQEVMLSDLPIHFDAAKEKYFFSLIHQQQVALFEHLFFDLIKIILIDKPERLSKKKQIDYGAIFESSTKEDLLFKLVDRELNDIKYKNVSEWFQYLSKLVGLPEILDDDLSKIAEAKATRDIFVHNAGITNQTYVNKSGNAARFTIGQRIDVSGHYTRDTWCLFVGVLVKTVDSVISKFEKNSA